MAREARVLKRRIEPAEEAKRALLEPIIGFNEAFHTLAGDGSPTDRDGFRRHTRRAWLEQALAATCTATVRRCRRLAER